MFWDRTAVEAAPALLGSVLRHREVALRITEVEAYEGLDDPASHAFRGPTPRTQVMFGPPGHLYVYRSYGIHRCANIVCGPAGRAAAVLLRAGQIVDGLDVARARRGDVPDVRLARGPGCVGQALGLDLELSGAPIATGDDSAELTLQWHPADPAAIRTGPRVGVSVAADVAWRFWLDDEPTVSRYARSPRAVRRVPPGPFAGPGHGGTVTTNPGPPETASNGDWGNE